jgi:hypothetical protein
VTISVPILMLVAIAAYIAYRHYGLKAWHATACLVLGFLLASTGAAPAVSSVLSGIVHQSQTWPSGGKGLMHDD